MPRGSTPITPARIVTTAEEVIAKHGPEKATVVDIARALGVSHGSVYRHFPSKAAIRAEVARRWLDRLDEPLREVETRADLTPLDRVHEWIWALSANKVRLAAEDPALFDAYVALVEESPATIGEHVRQLLEQLTGLVSDAMTAGEIRAGDPAAVAAELFWATSRFHDPLNRPRWAAPSLAEQLDRVWALLVRGLLP